MKAVEDVDPIITARAILTLNSSPSLTTAGWMWSFMDRIHPAFFVILKKIKEDDINENQRNDRHII